MPEAIKKPNWTTKQNGDVQDADEFNKVVEAVRVNADVQKKQLRVDVNQNFTDAEKTQARQNIGVSSGDGLPDDFNKYHLEHLPNLLNDSGYEFPNLGGSVIRYSETNLESELNIDWDLAGSLRINVDSRSGFITISALVWSENVNHYLITPYEKQLIVFEDWEEMDDPDYKKATIEFGTGTLGDFQTEPIIYAEPISQTDPLGAQLHLIDLMVVEGTEAARYKPAKKEYEYVLSSYIYTVAREYSPIHKGFAVNASVAPISGAIILDDRRVKTGQVWVINYNDSTAPTYEISNGDAMVIHILRDEFLPNVNNRVMIYSVDSYNKVFDVTIKALS